MILVGQYINGVHLISMCFSLFFLNAEENCTLVVSVSFCLVGSVEGGYILDILCCVGQKDKSGKRFRNSD